MTKSICITCPAEKTKNPSIHPINNITAIRYNIVYDLLNTALHIQCQIVENRKKFYNSFSINVFSGEKIACFRLHSLNILVQVI